jgi:glycine/serine hydroxymethyltransferase
LSDQDALTPFAARLDAILHEHQEFRRHTVPLCAAETPVSAYVRSFMVDSIHETYAMGGPMVPAAGNFIGAQYVLDLHQLTIDLCRDAFGAVYADPRPLSGTHAVTSLLMTLSEPGQRVLLQTPASGGHPSMVPICRRLGLEIIDLPYDYDHFQIDERACRDLGEAVDFVLVAPSDILYPPSLEALGFADATTVVYDATQILGLIASGHLPCPLDAHPRLVVSGGTHKTLPGPSTGLLMTQNQEIAARIDSELSPKFVRHSHPHHMAALCATLIEHREVGDRYSEKIQLFAGTLTRSLADQGLTVLQDRDRVTETHQVFLHIEPEMLDAAYDRAAAAGITLNKKRKPLFRETGLRLGVQEIARYRWTEADVERLAAILLHIVTGDVADRELRRQIRELAKLNVFADGLQAVPIAGG